MSQKFALISLSRIFVWLPRICATLNFVISNFQERSCIFRFELHKKSFENSTTFRGKVARTKDEFRQTLFALLLHNTVGSNDLCDESCDAETVSLVIEALVELLHKDLKVKFTMVCDVIPRENSPYTSYNEKVYQLNSYLKKALTNAPFAKTWHHHSLSNPTVNMYMPDGIHLNEAGNKALYRSY